MRVPSIAEELAGVEAGDARRTHRILSVVETLQAHPDASYPAVFTTDAALEGFYRLARNPAVTPEVVLDPHQTRTAARASGVACPLVIHDSTEIVHAAGNPAEDFYELQDGHHGYVAHVSLCVSFPERVPLGVLHVECVDRAEAETRAKKKQRSRAEAWMDPGKESLRWARGVAAAAERVPSAIHVTDREGDSYELLALFGRNRFVVRGAYDRRVIDRTGERCLVLEVGAREEMLFSRNSPLTPRTNRGRKADKYPSRPARTARLAVSAAPVSLVRPDAMPAENALGVPMPKTLEVNVVFVRELEPPEGEAAIEWLLYTTEPIETAEQVAAIVDVYRTRWLIEEFFKVLKTGCAFSRRQFESRKTSQTALALTLPVAWRMLLLRALDREFPDAPARVVLTEEELVVLAALTRRARSTLKTVKDVTTALARLGGHIKANGPPGWQVLGRAWIRLLEATATARALAAASVGADEEDGEM